MTKKRVSINDLWVAAQWLDIREDAEDKEACARVADMLHKMAAKREARAKKGVRK